MSVDLRGRVIAVTGASSGIGEATALACARAGMLVAVAARRGDRLDALVRTIEASGGVARAWTLDVTDAPACERFVAGAAGLSPRGLHAVFANAGYGSDEPTHAMSDAEVRRMFEVNFFGSLNVIRPALSLMRRNALDHGVRGHVLWCSSCLSLFAPPMGGVYSATKAAQHHFSRAMRIELEEEGIAVSSVHPIGTATEFSAVVTQQSGASSRTRTTPGLLMQPASRVADAVVACLKRPRAEVWPGVRAHAIRCLMSAGCACAPLGDFFRRRSLAKRGPS